MTMMQGTARLRSSAGKGGIPGEKCINNLIQLSMRQNAITEQNVDYALSLSFTEEDGQILEIDKDIICRTITGKPVKPKRLDRSITWMPYAKDDRLWNRPAGTGKTYLAMAMAIQAFKNGEVGRIILTRPAIEAGEKLGIFAGRSSEQDRSLSEASL